MRPRPRGREEPDGLFEEESSLAELTPPWLTCPCMQPPPLDFQGARWSLRVGSLLGELSSSREPLGSGVPLARELQLLVPVQSPVDRAGPRPVTSPLPLQSRLGPQPTVRKGMPTGLCFSGAGEVVLGRSGRGLLPCRLHYSSAPASGFWVSVSTSQS